MSSLENTFVAAMIIPTGVGASIGGFGGDATQEMNLLASVSDVLITHPNVANAAAFQKLPENALYVEGYGLDQFFKGHWVLRPVRKNRVGVVFDCGIEPRMLTLHLNALNAVKTVYGVDIIGYVQTEKPVQISCAFDTSGASSGDVENPDVILSACDHLLKQGAQAIALCCQMPQVEGEAEYKSGKGVDPIGGIEAILSHAVVSQRQIPCAHAPVFCEADITPAFDELVDPRAASEFILSTFVPCVLTGLSRAPHFIASDFAKAGDLQIHDLGALVVPGNALGGVPVLCALEQKIPVIAVMDNETVLPVTAEVLGLPGVITAQSYYEAAGMLAALKQGLSVPASKAAVADVAPRMTQIR